MITGKKHTTETKKRISMTIKKRMSEGKIKPFSKGNNLGIKNKGKIPWNKGKKGVMPTPWNKGKDFMKGSDNPNWKGGVTPKYRSIRTSKEYKKWRTSVFERDNYTCTWCSYKGKGLNADHIKPFALFPKLRFNINNGRTLCTECHLKTDTYGGRIK